MRKYRKNTISCIFVITIAFTLTGCWNNRELTSLGIVNVMGLDLVDEKVKLTLEVIKPSGIKEGSISSSVSYVQSTGYTVFEAVRNLTMKYDRKIFFPHIKAYIFGEDLARSGLIDYLDWYQRDHELRRQGLILVAKGKTAESVMGIHGGIENTPADYLKKIAALQVANSKVQNVNVLEFLKTYYSKGIQSVTGIISKVEKVNIESTDANKFELSAEGAAVFSKGKLIGYLDGSETRGFNFVSNKSKSGLIAFENPVGKGRTSIEILKSKSENSVVIEGNNINLKVVCNVNGAIGEETGEVDLKNPKVIEELEEFSAREIKEDIIASIEKAKNIYNCDIFGFGNIVHRKYPEKWKIISKDWDKLFQNSQVEIVTNVKLTRTGIVDLPANMMEE